MTRTQDCDLQCDPRTGEVTAFCLYGQNLLDPCAPSGPELFVNDVPLVTRPLAAGEDQPPERLFRSKGERWVDHFTGWGLVVTRSMGERPAVKHRCLGIQHVIRREPADPISLPDPGPGGPPIEAPLHVDTFGVMNWNWRFWGDDTRMIFASAHSSGPSDEQGHVGYEHDTPERCKAYMRNVWRRLYPGTMVIHGGVFHSIKTGHWIAITCRRPHVGYILNIERAGRGVGFDFTLHAPFPPGETLVLPEIKIHYGPDVESMWRFMADYATFYYEPTPDWVYRTLWTRGLCWDNQPTWEEQAEDWERRLDRGLCNGISYCLVTNRPIRSGTTPTGYEPDPNYGSIDAFRRMCRRITDRGVPLLIWLSHSGLMYRGGAEIDDDWFIRGIDGRICAAWGSADQPSLAHINPGHPGYIAYTCKWIRFYMQACGVKGFFFDCLGWAFPADFTPRAFMRYPGDTNRMTIRFMDAVFACIQSCDPDGLCFGEGTTFDGPVNLVSINHNPVRAMDGMGPRDYLLALNRHTQKRIVLDQGPRAAAAAGFVQAIPGEEYDDRNRFLAALLRDKGGPDAFLALPGDLSVMEGERLLVVPLPEGEAVYSEFRLSGPWASVTVLEGQPDGERVTRGADGAFRAVRPGVYRMWEEREAASGGFSHQTKQAEDRRIR